LEYWNNGKPEYCDKSYFREVLGLAIIPTFHYSFFSDLLLFTFT
jgi:hypothetical protein